MILFVDTETTGLPTRYADPRDQPYVVQLAAILCGDRRAPVARLNLLIRPEGWVIPPEATAIHGFTTAHCNRYGVPLATAIQEFASLWTQAQRVVSYNIAFDEQMLSVSARRVGAALPPRDLFCAMRESAKVINSNGRWVKLGVAYQCFFGRHLEDAHKADADVEACKEIYYALTDALAPISQTGADVRTMSARSLRLALNGIGEVEEHQKLLTSLVELHNAPLLSVDWNAILRQQDPQPPHHSKVAETAALQRLQSYKPNLIERFCHLSEGRIRRLGVAVALAREQDRRSYDIAVPMYKARKVVVSEQRHMAKRVLTGDLAAYAQVLDEVDLCASPLIGRYVIYSFPDSTIAEVYAYLNGSEVVPEQMKTLLSSGRISIKKRAKKDFALLYQDHLCSVVLRLGRDFFGRLPLHKLLVHGFIPVADSATGQVSERCVISALLSREMVNVINFRKIDPSDCLASFPCAMKISRGTLVEVTPLGLDGQDPKTTGRGRHPRKMGARGKGVSR